MADAQTVSVALLGGFAAEVGPDRDPGSTADNLNQAVQAARKALAGAHPGRSGVCAASGRPG
jgi:hypothetical protein